MHSEGAGCKVYPHNEALIPLDCQLFVWPELQERYLDMASHLELLLTPRQAADFLGVPSGTLAQWRSERRGPPFIKLENRLVRYRRSDLEEYLAGHVVATNRIEAAPIAVRISS